MLLYQVMQTSSCVCSCHYLLISSSVLAWPSLGTSAGDWSPSALSLCVWLSKTALWGYNHSFFLLAQDIPRSWLEAAHVSEGFMHHQALSSTPTGRTSAETWEGWSSPNGQQAAKKVPLNLPLWDPRVLQHKNWATDRYTPGAWHHWQVPMLGRKDQEVNMYFQ